MSIPQNNRWVALTQEDVLIVLKAKYSVHMMEFVEVTGDGNVMLLFIIPHGLKFNMKA